MNRPRMEYRNFLYLLLPLSLALFSCADSLQKRLEYTLRQAGANGRELEKVLEHYQDQPLKLEAARFLIANMAPHHSYEGWEIDSLKQVKRIKMLTGRIDGKVLRRWKSFDFRNSSVIRDVDVVKADVLIDNIDLAFEAWNRRPWSKCYTFEEFCEYVLPYRIDNEPFEDWRRAYYERYSPILDSLYQGSDVVEAARIMAEYLKGEGFCKCNEFSLPHLGALFLLDTRVGYCRENCDIATYVMRALGLPITMDFYKMSPSYNSRHFWSALIDTTGLAVPFNYAEDKVTRQQSIPEKKKGKVYRLFYDIQTEKLDGLYADESVPPFFRNFFLSDVSEEYFPNSHVEMELDEDIDDDWGYLCVFTGSELSPIDVARVRGSRVRFDNVEPELIYFPACNRMGRMCAIGYPFLAGNEGIRYFIPDTSRCGRVTLTRKYPMRYNRTLLGTAVGVRIEGANERDLSDAELLCEIVDTPTVNYNILRPSVKGKFRYIRYSAPKGKLIQLGEWAMFTKSQEWPLKIYAIEANHEVDELCRTWFELMMDGDWSTYYLSEVEGEQLVFDLGLPQTLDRFLLIPRNDDNFIHPGDLYELFYHDGVRGWVSLGSRIAEDTLLHFENVPEGALLWLHNHTRGKEERCFYMENGRQIFV